jgi:hypothetical protein
LTATSGDGAISVTVAANGSVIDLAFTNSVKSFQLAELSQQILATMRRAQAGITDRVAEVMNEQLGTDDDAARTALVDSLRDVSPTLMVRTGNVERWPLNTPATT